MALVGPGAINENQIAPDPTLAGASEYEYVTILNPLSDDFAIKVAQDVPVNRPFEIRGKTGAIQEENDVRREYGLNLKNPEHPSTERVIMNSSIIPAGKTINLKGNEAQVAVRQLVNEILQREGKRLLMSDPNLRKEVEDRIIIQRGSMQDLLGSPITTPQAQINEAVNKSNEVTDEQEFPGLDSIAGESDSSPVRDTRDSAGAQAKRSPSSSTKTK
jgi:hypothetical protein